MSTLNTLHALSEHLVPQLICQALYASIGGFTDTAAFATSASILSVISTLLSYAIEQRDGNVTVAQYFINLRRRQGDAASSPSHNSVASSSLEAEQGANELSSGERFKILCNRDRTRALSFSLSAIWGIEPKRIEGGNTMLSKLGARTHIVHYLYDLQGVDPLFHVQQSFAASANGVAQAMRQHFGLGDDFMVHFEAKRADNVAVDRVTQFESALALYLGSSPDPDAEDLNAIRLRVNSLSPRGTGGQVEMRKHAAGLEGNDRDPETIA